jgi:hypothetical protein
MKDKSGSIKSKPPSIGYYHDEYLRGYGGKMIKA